MSLKEKQRMTQFTLRPLTEQKLQPYSMILNLKL